jgi:hypothetical protein
MREYMRERRANGQDWDSTNAERQRRWADNHWAEKQDKNAARLATEAKQTPKPKWVNRAKMNRIKQHWALLNQIAHCASSHHVDHIFPLTGFVAVDLSAGVCEVCGLNAPSNLQDLLDEKNLAKGNRLVISEVETMRGRPACRILVHHTSTTGWVMECGCGYGAENLPTQTEAMKRAKEHASILRDWIEVQDLSKVSEEPIRQSE